MVHSSLARSKGICLLKWRLHMLFNVFRVKAVVIALIYIVIYFEMPCVLLQEATAGSEPHCAAGARNSKIPQHAQSAHLWHQQILILKTAHAASIRSCP